MFINSIKLLTQLFSTKYIPNASSNNAQSHEEERFSENNKEKEELNVMLLEGERLKEAEPTSLRIQKGE